MKLTSKNHGSERMNKENRDIDFIKVDLKSFQSMCKQIDDLKARCKELSKENLILKNEISDMKFTRNYLTSEEAGKAFAMELLGKPMTHEEVAIEQAENSYVPYSGDDF